MISIGAKKNKIMENIKNKMEKQKNIKTILIVLFWAFSIRQIMLFSDILGFIFLLILALSVTLSKDK